MDETKPIRRMPAPEIQITRLEPGETIPLKLKDGISEVIKFTLEKPALRIVVMRNIPQVTFIYEDYLIDFLCADPPLPSITIPPMERTK